MYIEDSNISGGSGGGQSAAAAAAAAGHHQSQERPHQWSISGRQNGDTEKRGKFCLFLCTALTVLLSVMYAKV